MFLFENKEESTKIFNDLKKSLGNSLKNRKIVNIRHEEINIMKRRKSRESG